MARLPKAQYWQKTIEAYQDRDPYTSFLAIGDTGAGKTVWATSGPWPALVIQFDPTGADSVRKLVREGKVVVADYSKDDPANPTEFQRFTNDFNRWNKEGAFSDFRVVVLDSLTTFADSVMYQVQKTPKKQAGKIIEGSKPGEAPIMSDYMYQQAWLMVALKAFLGVPAHRIATGHIALNKDEVTGSVYTGLMITGKLDTKIPLLFSELYHLEAKKSNSGADYIINTSSTVSRERVRTRIGADGKLPRQMTNTTLREILKKCGYDYQDAELFPSAPDQK